MRPTLAPLALTCLSGLSLLSAVASAAPLVGTPFPESVGKNLLGREFLLPRDLGGKANLVIVAFQRWHQSDVDTWVPAFRELAARYPGLGFYELPVLGSDMKLFRGVIDGGMRRGIDDDATSARTITLYLDKRPFRSALDIPDESSIHALLLDASGRVTWRVAGAFDASYRASLEASLAALLAPTSSPAAPASPVVPAGAPSSVVSGDLVGVAQSAGLFRTLLAAAEAAGLVDTLRTSGPYTVFAPTDDAFSKLPAGTVEQLLRPENRDTLRAILTYHVTLGRLASKDLPTLAMWRTLEGDMLTFALDGTSTVVEGARIVKADVAATNGTIHVIDRVLLPRAVAKALAARSTAPVPGGHGPDASSGSVGDVLRLAIERGVPLYNRGQHEACAAVYEVAARALLASPSTPGDARTVLRAGLADMARQADAAEQAWALRRAFDRVLAAGA